MPIAVAEGTRWVTWRRVGGVTWPEAKDAWTLYKQPHAGVQHRVEFGATRNWKREEVGQEMEHVRGLAARWPVRYCNTTKRVEPTEARRAGAASMARRGADGAGPGVSYAAKLVRGSNYEARSTTVSQETRNAKRRRQNAAAKARGTPYVSRTLHPCGRTCEHNSHNGVGSSAIMRIRLHRPAPNLHPALRAPISRALRYELRG